MIGLPPNHKIVYIIDFGLSKYFMEERTNSKGTVTATHIPQKTGMSLGTPRYMSIYSHKCETLSRRDDLISIGYVLIYLAKGGK